MVAFSLLVAFCSRRSGRIACSIDALASLIVSLIVSALSLVLRL